MTPAVTTLPADPLAATPAADGPAQNAAPRGEFLTVLLQLVRLDGAMTPVPVPTDPTVATSPDAAGDDEIPAPPGSGPRAIATLDPHAGAPLAALDPDAGPADGNGSDEDTAGDDPASPPTALVAAALAVPGSGSTTTAETPAAGGSAPSPAAGFERAGTPAIPAAASGTAAAGDPSASAGGSAETDAPRDAGDGPARDTTESPGAPGLDPPAAGRSTATDAARLLRDRATVVRAAGEADEPPPGGGDSRPPATTPVVTTSHVVPEPGMATTRAESSPRAEAPAAAPRPLIEQVAERVVRLRRDGGGEIALRLDPPDLGAIRIEAVIEGGKLRLEIRAEAEPARQALESSLPRLRESLAQQGIVADQVSVHLGLDSAPREFTGGQSAPTPRLLPSPMAPRLVAPVAQLAPARADGVDVWV